jgi:hypothetical protein
MLSCFGPRIKLGHHLGHIDSDSTVPIHTEGREWFAGSFENVVPEEGIQYDFYSRGRIFAS